MAVKRIPRELPSPRKGAGRGRPKGSPKPPGAGRKPGSTNRFTLDIKEASLLAACMHGTNGQGKDQLVGYMFMLARDYPQTYCREILGKILPVQVMAQVATGSTPNEIPKQYTRDELVARLKERGINVTSINLDKSEYKSIGTPSSNGTSSNGYEKGKDP